jgi:hypothetical protein
MVKDFFSRNHIPFSLVFDISSGSVGVAIVEENPSEKKPLIVYTYREPIRPAKGSSPELYLRTLKEALLAVTLEVTSAGMHALTAHGGNIHTIRVLYAAPWSLIVSRTISLEKEEAFSATFGLVDTLVTQALTSAEAPLHEELIFERTGFEVVHQELTDAKLNGYAVTDFTGQQCVSIEVTHLSELVPQTVREAVKDAVRHLALHGEVTEHAFARASTHAVTHIFPHTDSFILVEFAGGATECVVVENGTVRESVSNVVGTHTFEQELAETLGTIREEVRGYLRDYTSQSTHDDITKAIQEARDGYKIVIGKLFAELRLKLVLPRNIITLAESEYSDLFLGMVEEEYAQHNTEYKVHALDNALMNSYVEYAEEVLPDHALAMIAIFFHTAQKNTALLAHK